MIHDIVFIIVSKIYKVINLLKSLNVGICFNKNNCQLAKKHIHFVILAHINSF